MYHIAEQNARRSRQTALVFAIALHVALGAVLYLQTSEKLQPQKATAVKLEKTGPLPKKAVNIP